MFVRLTEHQAVERVLVGAQGVDGGTAVVDKTVQQAEFGGGSTQLTHTDVNADIGQAALLPSVTQTGLQLLSTGLRVTRPTWRDERDKCFWIEIYSKGRKTRHTYKK